MYSELHGIPQRRHRVILVGVREDLYPTVSNILLPKDEELTSLKEVLSDLPPLRSGLSKITNSDDNWIANIKKDA